MAQPKTTEDIEVESQALGCLLLADEKAEELQREMKVRLTDFSTAGHRSIADAVFCLISRHEAVNYLSVEDELKARQVPPESYGGCVYITGLTDNIDYGMAGAYAKRLRLAAQRRKLEAHLVDQVTRLRSGHDLKDITAELAETAQACTPQNGNGKLVCLTSSQLIGRDLPVREFILDPILSVQDTMLIHGLRGLGKTHVSVGIAVAAASGGQFLRWKAKSTRRTLLVDGEMPETLLRDRIAKAITCQPCDPGDNLLVITPDEQHHGRMPNLATPEGQLALEPALAGVQLLILDNISCLFRGIDENDAAEWEPAATWLLSLRSRGITSVLLHHDSKAGGQRGTSKREDSLSTVIHLRRPENYQPTDGARFEVHITKGRSLFGPNAAPFEASLSIGENGSPEWTTRSLGHSSQEIILEMYQAQFPIKDIIAASGCKRTWVFHVISDAKKKGLIS